jgi:hypothetical protein
MLQNHYIDRTMSMKEETDKLVSAKLSKIEKGREVFSNFLDKRRQLFSPMKVVLEEICSALDEEYIECQLRDNEAQIELIRASTTWKITLNYTLQQDKDLNYIDYSFDEEKKYQVDDYVNKLKYFKDEAAVSEYLLEPIVKHIATYMNVEKRRQKIVEAHPQS